MSESLEQTLSELLETPIQVLTTRPLSGGCISEVLAVSIAENSASHVPNELVVKQNDASMIENFRCECEGLEAIAASETIRVPKPLATGVVQQRAYLVMEFVEASSRSSRDFERFGRALAEFHEATLGDEIGWRSDNFLGAATQPNKPHPTWTEFVAAERLGFQLRWAIDQRLADQRLRNDVEQIIASLEDLLSGRDEQTSLLHGDLWSGNYLFDTSGDPVLLDPAVYRGCREAEWGMIKLFGSCPAEFGKAYQETWPMPDGWDRRAMVYLLYHELNHLNLFGGGYLGGCKQTAQEILSRH